MSGRMSPAAREMAEAQKPQRPTFAIQLKSPLLKKPKEVRLPVGGRVKDLKRCVLREFSRNRTILMLGQKELKNGDETLEGAGVRAGVTVAVLNKITSGLVGNLETSIESEDSTRENGPILGPMVPGSFFFPVLPFGGPPLGHPDNPYPTIEGDELPPQPIVQSVSSEEKTREATAAAKTKAKMADLKRRKAKPSISLSSKSGSKKGPFKDISETHSESTDATDPDTLSRRALSAPVVVPSASASSPKATPANPNNCTKCNRVLKLLEKLECRCKGRFCKRHRNPDKHECTFNYKKAARRHIAKNNPKPAPKSAGL